MAELYSISGRKNWFEFEQISSEKLGVSNTDGLIQGTNWAPISIPIEVSEAPILHNKEVD